MLDKLNALQVQAIHRKKLGTGLSPTTVRNIHATLYEVLRGGSWDPRSRIWLLPSGNIRP